MRASLIKIREKHHHYLEIAATSGFLIAGIVVEALG